MSQTRRRFLATATVAAGGTVFLPFAARAAGEGADTFATPGGDIIVHPVSHASFVLETPAGVIHVDPVGGAGAYASLPAPALILITHEHGDHFDAETLAGLVGPDTQIVANPAVHAMLPEELRAQAGEIANGGTTTFGAMSIEAIPAYNITEARLDFHPQGRDNGYVLGFDGFRIYVSGDTEDIPEMRALENIDLAFVCMNLPFTMDAAAAADAVAEFAPAYVYPYHFRGRDDGTQNPEDFASLVGDASEVRIGNWYPGGLSG